MDTIGTGLCVLSVLRAGWEGRLGYETTFGTLLRMGILVILPGLSVMPESLGHFQLKLASGKPETWGTLHIKRTGPAHVTPGCVTAVSMCRLCPVYLASTWRRKSFVSSHKCLFNNNLQNTVSDCRSEG